MKYNIYINQYKLSENKQVTIQECAVIDWLYTMFGTTSEKVVNKRAEGWTWVSLTHLMEDMPLLRIKTNSGASKLINKIKSLGYITTRTDRKERKLYAKPTEKMKDLYFSNPAKGQVRKDETQVLQETSQVLQDSNHNTNINTLNNIPSTGSASEGEVKDKALEKVPYSFIGELTKLRDSPRHDLKVIALYWSVKGFVFENEEQFKAGLKRELRAASLLKGYSGTQIAQAIEYCKKNYDVWTLETCAKRIADLINKK